MSLFKYWDMKKYEESIESRKVASKLYPYMMSKFAFLQHCFDNF